MVDTGSGRNLKSLRTNIPFMEPAYGARGLFAALTRTRERTMNGLIYLIGLIVVIMAILSFFGLR